MELATKLLNEQGPERISLRQRKLPPVDPSIFLNGAVIGTQKESKG